MERVNRILSNPAYQEAIRKNEELERDRRYCHHDMAHFLDVARIAMLLAVKEKLPISQAQKLSISQAQELSHLQVQEVPIMEALVYAAALVHDIGRYRQYEDGTPHEQASAELAPKILLESGFDQKETDVIVDAVRSHRNENIAEERSLRGLLYRADKLSRACFACFARQECNWSADKKNMQIVL